VELLFFLMHSTDFERNLPKFKKNAMKVYENFAFSSFFLHLSPYEVWYIAGANLWQNTA
jgi:hypothetical protein